MTNMERDEQRAIGDDMCAIGYAVGLRAAVDAVCGYCGGGYKATLASDGKTLVHVLTKEGGTTPCLASEIWKIIAEDE